MSISPHTVLCVCVLRGIPTHRSWVRKIRFAPGKGNQKLVAMYNDGAEVWDTKEVGPAWAPQREPPASSVTAWWAVRLRTVSSSDMSLHRVSVPRGTAQRTLNVITPLGPLWCSLHVGGRQTPESLVLPWPWALAVTDQKMSTLCSS